MALLLLLIQSTLLANQQEDDKTASDFVKVWDYVYFFSAGDAKTQKVNIMVIKGDKLDDKTLLVQIAKAKLFADTGKERPKRDGIVIAGPADNPSKLHYFSFPVFNGKFDSDRIRLDALLRQCKDRMGRPPQQLDR